MTEGFKDVFGRGWGKGARGYLQSPGVRHAQFERFYGFDTRLVQVA